MDSSTPEAVPPIVPLAAPSASRSFDIVAAGIMVSRIAGFVRNWAAARYLGIGVAADALRVASIIPNIIRNLLGEGAISASFIPVYSGLLARADERGARALAGALLGFLLATVSILTLAGVAAAPLLTSLLASGWDDPAKIALTNRLLRILFPMAGLMVISGWCLGIQNAHRDYFMSYASAAVWSIVQIVLLFGWGSRAGDVSSPALFGLGYRTGDTAQLAVWLAWAMVAGSVAQIAVQLPKVLRHVRPLRSSLDRNAPGLQQTIRNFLPVVVSLGVVQISGLVDLTIASYLPEGAPSSLGYAALIYMLPGSVFAISVAASSLPDFARDAIGAVDAVRTRLREGWLRILFYIIPTTALYLFYGDLVVSILLRSGRFGSDDTHIVRWIVAGYSVGLIGFSSVRLLASAFHAFQDYRTPLRASIAAITTSGVLALAFALPFRESIYATVGLGIASAIGAYVNLSILLGGLHKRLGVLFTPAMWGSTARVGMAAGVAALGAYPVRLLLADMHYLITAAGTLSAFGGIFLLTAHAAGNQEATRWLRKLRVVRRSP